MGSRTPEPALLVGKLVFLASLLIGTWKEPGADRNPAPQFEIGNDSHHHDKELMDARFISSSKLYESVFWVWGTISRILVYWYGRRRWWQKASIRAYCIC